MERASIPVLLGFVIGFLGFSAGTYLSWFRTDLVKKTGKSARPTGRGLGRRILEPFVYWGASDLALWNARLIAPLGAITCLVVLILMLLYGLDV